ncbi:Glycoside hydrolase family 9, partial [Trinorchestia longiramus]
FAGTAVVADENPCAATGQTPYDYQQALCMSILFYEANRSGPLPSDMRFDWRGDSALDDGSDVGVDLTGGYYDAGDHVKFGYPMAYTITVLAWGLLSYREGYEAAGQVEYTEAAIRWGTDYFLKAHSADMLLWGQVGEGQVDHSYWGRPEEMTMERPSMKIDTSAPGSDLAAETAAALTAASMVFQDNDPDYAATCLEAARNLFDFADQYRLMYHESITDAANFYKSFNGFGDELAWGSMWLYKATGEEDYATKAKEYWTEFDVHYNGYGFSWDNKFAGAQILYAEEFTDPEYSEAVRYFLESMRSREHTPGGMFFLDPWGSLRHAVNVAFIAFKGSDLGIDEDINRDWAVQQLNYALGSVGHSYMVGFGVDPPERPHHRASSCPDLPEPCETDWAQNQPGPNPQVLYGAMVGGPDVDDGYTDERMDYMHNEVACDYNAALSGALAKMVIL